ncbi:hypothetical protein AXG93_163s1310 [Marchantia polymorpha subsp. ruderalis]|uniref:Reverse transcriptase RNase H-like domain-containing protein n=1 Tax=Marchantia polymorpha subsp. ruderalis TaxID=1480154 RepID=A0A176VC62_MARPO|nr:hypothetical protein AXG93_163s1310 [Marchantia polymorpha subsp. ruderalis]
MSVPDSDITRWHQRQEKVEYLDHVIYPGDLGVQEAKVKAIARIPRPADFTLVTDHQPLKWLMESDKLTGKLARWALILQEYDFQVVHRPGVANLDADGLSRNPCTSQEDDTGARWHGEVDEEMVPGWHASAFMCWLRGASSSEDHLTSYSSQRVDSQSSDPEVEDGGVDQRDVHDDALVLEFLRTSMVPGTVGAKERDRVLQRAKRYRLEGAHVLRVWEDGTAVGITLHGL